ncbi:MAG: hypothetical protein ABIM36_03525 [candidate division WOR-3 bacterium]
MKVKIAKILLIGGIITGYGVLYAPEELVKGKGSGQIQWIEGTRGWREDGTNLWTSVSPLPSYNVGIGTNLPTHKLHVVGSSRIQGDLYINSWPISVTSQPTSGYVLKWDGSAFTPQPDIGGVGGSGTATQVAFWTSSNTIGGNSNLWWDNTNNRLGIGTSSPAYRLDVVGASRIQGDLYINSWPIRVASQPTSGYVLKWDGSAFTPQPDIGGVGGSGTATQVAFWTSSNTIGGNSNLWWDNTNNRLGIGTSSPAYRLDVVGASRIQGDLYINSWPISVTSTPTVGYVLKWNGTAFVPQADATGIGGSGTATQVAFWTSSTTIGGNNNLWWDNANARLGIGTNAPTHNLHVTGSARIDGDFYNQEVGAAQVLPTAYGNPTVLQQVTITTHGAGSAVLITAHASFTAENPGWYSISIHRDGTGTAQELTEVSEGTADGYEDMTLAITWIDNPPEGTHTYYLIFGTNGYAGYFYSHALEIVEIKK